MKDNLCGKKYFPQSCKDEMRESPVDRQINVLRLCQRRFFQNRQYFAVDSSKEYLPTQVAFHVAKSTLLACKAILIVGVLRRWRWLFWVLCWLLRASVQRNRCSYTDARSSQHRWSPVRPRDVGPSTP